MQNKPNTELTSIPEGLKIQKIHEDLKKISSNSKKIDHDAKKSVLDLMKT